MMDVICIFQSLIRLWLPLSTMMMNSMFGSLMQPASASVKTPVATHWREEHKLRKLYVHIGLHVSYLS